MAAMIQPLAVVVGGSGAIGSAVAAELAKRGYGVLGTYRRRAPEAAGGICWVGFDAESGGAEDLREALEADSRPLEVVVYAAGIASSKQLVAATPVEEFTRLQAVNALGLPLAWSALADRARQGAAAVVAVSSDTTRSAGPGNGAYTASKAALEALAVTMAKEEAPFGVRVNVVAPALVDSPMAAEILARKGIVDTGAYFATLPGGRALSVAEVAAVIVAVATDPAWSYATGMVHRLAAEGGRS